jgi:hypothetical protein
LGLAALTVGGIAEHLRSLAPRSWLLVLLALALGAAGIAVQDGPAQALIFSKAGTLLVLALSIRFCVQLARSAVLREEALLTTLFADDPRVSNIVVKIVKLAIAEDNEAIGITMSRGRT